VGRVLDQGDPGIGAEPVDLVAQGRAAEVHADHRVEPAVLQRGGERPGRQVEGVGLDVERHRPQPAVERGQRGRHEGPGGHADPGAPGQTQVGRGDLERRGARGQRDDVLDAEVLGQLGLERAALLAGGDPAAQQRPGGGLDLGPADVGCGESDLGR
jgi:hypothetical protein